MAHETDDMMMMDTPVLLIRGSGGEVRAFLNSCSHRGAVVMATSHYEQLKTYASTAAGATSGTAPTIVPPWANTSSPTL